MEGIERGEGATKHFEVLSEAKAQLDNPHITEQRSQHGVGRLGQLRNRTISKQGREVEQPRRVVLAHLQKSGVCFVRALSALVTSQPQLCHTTATTTTTITTTTATTATTNANTSMQAR